MYKSATTVSISMTHGKVSKLHGLVFTVISIQDHCYGATFILKSKIGPVDS